MKELAVIAIIMAFIAGIGVTCIIWAIAWLSFEATKIGQEITETIRVKLIRRRY